MKIRKRIGAAILSLALVMTGLSFVPKEAEEAKATSSATSAVYEVVEAESVMEEAGIPVKDGYLFAGWYSSEECTLETASTRENATYAKFVREDVLDVKMQISNRQDERAVRFVSSVESLNYREVGFVVNGNTEKTYATTTVYERIYSQVSELEYTFSPKVVGTTSEYFFTAKMAVAEENANTEYTVWAYWKTLDGTIVTGKTRSVNVSEDSSERSMNLTLDGVVSADTTTTFTTSRMMETGEDDKTVENATVKVLASGKDYTNVRISWNDGITVNELASATKITVGDATGIYRNYYTGYTGSGSEDTSWYEIDTAATEFVVATAADLQGMAYVLNNKKDATNFAENTVNLVRNVTVNSETLVEDGAPTSAAGTGTGLIAWEPIGCESAFFQGTFDGGYNVISGVYVNETTKGQGLFGCTLGSSKIQNLQLSNSYIVSSNERVGGIAGWGEGSVENAYVDAGVYLSGNGAVGGIVGFYGGSSTVSVSKCWFAGTAYSSSYYLGGIAGALYNGNKTISESLFTGTVQSTSNNTITGGIAGGGAASKTVMTLKNCVSTGSVNSETIYRWVGGAFGSLNFASDASVDYELTMENVYTTNKRDYTAGADSFPTTTEGANDGMGTYTTNKTNIGVKGVAAIVTDDELKGEAGYTNTDLNFYSEQNEDGIWVATDDGPELEKFSSSATKVTTFTKKRSNIDWYRAQYTNATSGTMALPSTGVTFELDSAGDLNSLTAVTNGSTGATVAGTALTADHFSGDTLKLVSDIDLNPGWQPTVDVNGLLTNGTGILAWSPIGSFSGTFEGDNHEISGVYSVATTNQSGLFSTLDRGSVAQNFKLTNSYFESSLTDVGSIAGILKGTLKNVYSDAYVTASSQQGGGLIGRTQSTTVTIEDCRYDGELYVTAFTKTSAGYFGGIVGNLQVGPKSSEGTNNLTNCLFTGKVTKNVTKAGTANAILGGIAGGCHDLNRPAVLTNCLSAGTVYDVENCAGALVGQVKCFDSSITGCVAVASANCNKAFYFIEAAAVDGEKWSSTPSEAYQNACAAIMVESVDALEGNTILNYFTTWWNAKEQ